MKLNFKKTLLIGSMLINYFLANSQSPLAEGFVVTNDGDTLSGFIEVKESELNPADITFKSSLASTEEKKYSAGDIRYFSIKDFASWQSALVSVSMYPVEISNVDGFSMAPPVNKSVFLKVLQRGTFISLFSYRDDLKIRFYISYNEKIPQELVYRVIRVGARFAQGFAFREQLISAAEQSGGMNKRARSLIEKAPYKQGQLLEAVSSINGIQIRKATVANRVATGIRVGAGIQIANLRTYNDDEFSKNMQSSPSSLYWCSFGYDLARNPLVGALVFRSDLTLSLAELTMTTHDYRFSSDLDVRHFFKQRTVTLGLYPVYNLYNQEKLKFFISAGIRVNYSFYKTDYVIKRTFDVGEPDEFTGRDGEPRRLWTSIPIKAGFVIYKKFELGVTYSPTRVLSHGDFIYKYGINSIQAGVLYHF